MFLDDARSVADELGRLDESYDDLVEKWRALIQVRNDAGYRDESQGHLILKTREWVDNPDHPDLIEEQAGVTEKYRQLAAEAKPVLDAVRGFQRDHGLGDKRFAGFEAYNELSSYVQEAIDAVEELANGSEQNAQKMETRVVTLGPNDPYLDAQLNPAAVAIKKAKNRLQRLIWPPQFGSDEVARVDEVSRQVVKDLEEDSGSAFWLCESEGDWVLFVGQGNFPDVYTDDLKAGTLTMMARGSFGSSGSVEVSGAASKEGFKDAFGRLSKKDVKFA